MYIIHDYHSKIYILFGFLVDYDDKYRNKVLNVYEL